MPKLFSEERTNPSRALQLWQILISKAHNRQLVTYEQLAGMIGYSVPIGLREPLGHLLSYCRREGIPFLTALVVQKDTGVPGQGFPAENTDAERERVFNFNWYDIIPPTPDNLHAD